MPKKDVVQWSDHQRGLLYALIQQGNAPPAPCAGHIRCSWRMNNNRRKPWPPWYIPRR
jgi:hypothetical protein